MPHPVYIVDAFIIKGSANLTGNPAAIIFLEYDSDITDDEKQKLASEMNLSVTTFVSHGWTKEQRLSSLPEITDHLTLRWFTPTNEIPLCGHGTMATTKAILHLDSTKTKGQDKIIRFETQLKGSVLSKVFGEDELITLNFPLNPPHDLKLNAYPWLNSMIENTLGKKLISNSSLNIVQDISYSPGIKALVLRLRDDLHETGLAEVEPDFQALMQIEAGGIVVMIIVTVKGYSDSGNNDLIMPDFYSRVFMPWNGIGEDPVCGIAHSVLTPYWNQELGPRKKQDGSFFVRQHSSRGGDLKCTIVDDRVELSGYAKVIVKGEVMC